MRVLAEFRSLAMRVRRAIMKYNALVAVIMRWP